MNFRLVVAVVVVSLVALTVCVSPALAAPEAQPEMPDTEPMADYVAAVGVGALITLAVQILKAVEVVPDGRAGAWATTANVVAFAALHVAGAFGFDVTGSAVQDVLAVMEQAGKLALMVVTSPTFYDFLRNAEVVGGD